MDLPVPSGSMLKKFHVALFLNTGTPSVPVWKQIKKSTANDIAMNPETKVYDYIADEAPTTELDRYAPSLSQPITMYKGEPEYEYLFSKFFEQDVGADAHSEILVVFYGADGAASSYKAWKASCMIQIDNLNPVESVITAQINFNGTVEKGTATVTAGVPEFTGDTTVEFLQTFTVQTGGSDQAGALVTCNGVEKLTDDNGEASFFLVEGEQIAVGATYLTTDAAAVFEADHLAPTLTLALT